MILIRRMVVAVTAGATAAALTFTAPAHAAPAADPAALAATNQSSARADTGKALSAQQYWTPERMAAATPIDLPEKAAAPAAVQPRIGPKGEQKGVAPPKQMTREASIHSMSGRVFFVDDHGENHSCSGSTVNSDGKRLVFTAGHCVHGGGSGRGWFDVNRWVFVPAYHAGQPYGTWSAFQQWTKNGWINNGDRAWDVAAVVMQDKNGQRIVDAVGGQGIKWGYGYGLFEYMFGYPADPPFDGSQLYYCYGTTRSESGFPTLDCNMTGGASGGPWLENYGVTFWAYLNGVNSWMFWRNNDPTQVFKWQSPYFSYDTAGSLFDTVKNM
jgi:V8-like Glu-specific endopeptidase